MIGYEKFNEQHLLYRYILIFQDVIKKHILQSGLMVFILLSGCYPPDYEGYYKIPDHHYSFFNSFPDSLQFHSGDSVLWKLTNTHKETLVKSGSADYAEHLVLWDYEYYTSEFSSENVKMELAVSFLGNPYEDNFPIIYYFTFHFPESNSYKFCYYFDNPDTLNFYNDSIIELECSVRNEAVDGLITTCLLKFKKSVGILELEGIEEDRMYRLEPL